MSTFRTNHNKKKNLSDSINLIPMINLIFLLLIFFMLTGVIKQKDINEINRPESSNGMKSNFPKNQISITINENGNIFLNNEVIKVKSLSSSLGSLDGKIIINIDKKSSIHSFNEVLEKIKMSKKKEVFVKVKDKAND